jgi:hypothetical protein
VVQALIACLTHTGTYMLYEQFHKPLASAERFAHETLIDGELLALGPGGKPSFNLIQNLRSAESHVIYYYAFDILFLHRGPCSARITSPDGDPMNTSVETM